MILILSRLELDSDPSACVLILKAVSLGQSCHIFQAFAYKAIPNLACWVRLIVLLAASKVFDFDQLCRLDLLLDHHARWLYDLKIG